MANSLLMDFLLEKVAFQPMPPTQPGQPPQGGGAPGGQPPPQGGPQGGPPPPQQPAPQGGQGGQGPQPSIPMEQMMQMMQDPQIQQQLQQQGITIGQQGPQGPDGQVIPPDQMAQILTQITQGGGQGSPAPAGGQPPPQGMPGTPMTVEMFQALMPQYLESVKSGHHSPTKERLDKLEDMVMSLAAKLGVGPAELSGQSPVAPEAMQAPMPMPTEQQVPPEMAAMSPEAVQASQEQPQDPSQGQPKMASEAPVAKKEKSPALRIQGFIAKMRNAPLR